ncbi:hypothetical protein [Neoaquamicrobium sediminum]|uniref:Uncharacterized protein n=1 Tax=Neoaquamicrobium sediminum TaxID=1849104 RepID=A0ABV3WUA2_9HYPH
MKSEEDIYSLEKLIGQLKGLHAEISQLAKKSPNDGLNVFKLKLVNKVIASANDILEGDYKPFDDFEQFDADDVPTNSDVTMILTQYMDQTERFRSDHVGWSTSSYRWYYLLGGKLSTYEGAAPSRVGEGKK